VRGVFLLEREVVAISDGLASPECPRDGVVLRIRGGAVCGGDLKTYRHWKGPFPRFMGGHEYSGEIAGVGAEVSTFAVGDAAVFCFGNFCGVCTNCRLGSPNFCVEKRPLANAGGGFAEYVAVVTPAHGCGLFLKPKALSFSHAAVAEPAGCAISAVERGRSKAGQWAAVVGLGAIGHFTCQVLCGMGVRVIGIDISDNRLQAAEPYCRETINSTRSDAVAVVMEITGGVGVDQAYEAVGAEATLAAALRMTRVSGTTVLVGVFGEPMKAFHPEWVFRRDLTVIGAKGRPMMTAQGEAVVLDYIERGIIQPDAVVTEFSHARAAEAFAAQNAAECLKAVLVSD
jgi:L-iditol 2-dehydrogenase